MARFTKLTIACAITLCAICLVAGCGGQDSQETAAKAEADAVTQTESVLGTLGAAEQDLVKKAAVIAVAIESMPNTAATVLAANGMTAEDFEDLIYRISADERLSAAFEEAKAQ